MSVMFDPEAAIYPFPPKPTPLSIDEKAYYREKIKRLFLHVTPQMFVGCPDDFFTQTIQMINKFDGNA